MPDKVTHLFFDCSGLICVHRVSGLNIKKAYMKVSKADNETSVEKFRGFPEYAEEFVDHQTGDDHYVVRSHGNAALRLDGTGKDGVERLRLSGQKGQQLPVIAVEATMHKIGPRCEAVVEGKTTLVVIKAVGHTIDLCGNLERLINSPLQLNDLGCGVDLIQAFFGEGQLGPADIIFTIERLAVQIRPVEAAIINQEETTDTSAYQELTDRRSQATDSGDQ